MPGRPSASPTGSETEIEVMSLKPGDYADLRVQLFDFPMVDMTHIRFGVLGFSTRLWVPTKLLHVVVRP